MSLKTDDLAPITTSSVIVMPGAIKTSVASQQEFPITIGFDKYQN